MSSPILEFNYDISCPFAYIASTRVSTLAHLTNCTIHYKPVLLGAIYRSTAAPQGAAGSASDVFNPTKKAVASAGMARTLKRYRIEYNPPKEHPRKSVDALRLLYCVEDGGKRQKLTNALFRAYWVENRDVTSHAVLLQIAQECNISGLSEASFANASARQDLETSTANAIERGAFGVPGFYIPAATWTDFTGSSRHGRYFWGQDRLHFVAATLLSLPSQTHTKNPWSTVPNLRSLLPRCTSTNTLPAPTKLQFWFDFSSPWAFLGYTQLPRLQRTFGPALEIEMKPFLLGALFREIGAPNEPGKAISPAKALWSRQDHLDWTTYWNAITLREGGKKDELIHFHWADNFPIRTPTVLRVALVDPRTTSLLYSACWQHNKNISSDAVLKSILDDAGYDGASLLAAANAPEVKDKLRALTAEAKALGICGVPTYRVLRRQGEGEWKSVGGLIWGQDEMNVVEDMIAGWDSEKDGGDKAEINKVMYEEEEKEKEGSMSKL